MKAQVKNTNIVCNTASRVSRKETLHLSLMVLPGLLLFFIFNYLPMLGIVIAFKKYNPNKGILGQSVVRAG